MRGLLLALSLLLATACPGSASPAVGLWQSDHLVKLAASTCTQAGQKFCSEGCTQVTLCVSDGQGGFEEVTLETCTGDTRCSSELETCVSGSTECGADTSATIECHATGSFPDPFDCTIYHICIDANGYSYRRVCEDGYAYNALTGECSYKTTDPVCTEGPVPACEEVGQSGPLDTNPSIYYICTSKDGVLTPSLYKCEHGQVYDPDKFGCVDSTSSTTTTTTPDPDSPPTPGGYCSPPLVREADPEDCTLYYECSLDNIWLHNSCIFGTYYNPVHNRCELGFC